MKINETVYYVGADDKTLDLFEGQYIIPNGISYNSYVIKDEKIAVMDTVDARCEDIWLENLSRVLGGCEPDYLIISHLEPDHSGSVEAIAEKFPKMQLVMTDKAKKMMPQFFNVDFEGRIITVGTGDELCLGEHTLSFIGAPMVHWPEVMMTYDKKDKILFSADGFGKFGALDTDEDWTCEARRYYFNIVGKYGTQVQAVLKAASTLDIEKICPLHGPILTDNLGFYIDKYNIWSSYTPEDDGVLIACASIHGKTMEAAKKLAEILTEKGAKKVVLTDLARDDIAEAVEDAFRYDKLIVASPTYDAGLFPCMEDFLSHLKAKAYQNRRVAVMENGSWAPMSAKLMRAYFEGMKNIELCEKQVTLRTSMKESNIAEMEEMAEELLNK